MAVDSGLQAVEARTCDAGVNFVKVLKKLVFCECRSAVQNAQTFTLVTT
jgi:hypothetical protein